MAKEWRSDTWPAGMSALGPARSYPHVRFDGGFRRESRLVVLTVSFVDPDRYCRKKILRESSSNIDSRRASNAQDRFKNPACTILLLRVVRVAPTFSTASTHNRLSD